MTATAPGQQEHAVHLRDQHLGAPEAVRVAFGRRTVREAQRGVRHGERERHR